MKRARELIAATVLAVLGLAFGLGILEAGVRLLHLVPDRFWEPDAVLGVRLAPGRHGWWTQEEREFLVPVRVNRQGLRDVEHEYEKPPGVFRILVLGDSFVEAMHVPLEAVFARLLEEQLGAGDAAPRIEVVSAGVSGYGTASEVLYFEREGRRYQPDLVLLAFYPGNDVKNNSPVLEDALKPVYSTDGTLQRVAGQKAREQPRGWRALLARCASYRYLRQVLLTRHPRLARTLVGLGLLRRDAIRAAPERDGVPVDYWVYAPQLQPSWEEAWQFTERLLARLQQAVAAAGARLAIVVLCGRDQIYPEWWEEVLQAHPAMRSQSWDLDAPQRRIVAWCTLHDVPCIELTPAFRAAVAKGGEPLHFRHDGHWTPAGHRLAATVLNESLGRLHLLPRRGKGASDEIH